MKILFDHLFNKICQYGVTGTITLCLKVHLPSLRLNMNEVIMSRKGHLKKKLFEDLIELDEFSRMKSQPEASISVNLIQNPTRNVNCVESSNFDSILLRVDTIENSISKLESDLENRARKKALLMVRAVEARWCAQNEVLKGNLSDALRKIEFLETDLRLTRMDKILGKTRTPAKLKVPLSQFQKHEHVCGAASQDECDPLHKQQLESKFHSASQPCIPDTISNGLELEYARLENSGLRHRVRKLEDENVELRSLLKSVLHAGLDDHIHAAKISALMEGRQDPSGHSEHHDSDSSRLHPCGISLFSLNPSLSSLPSESSSRSAVEPVCKTAPLIK